MYTSAFVSALGLLTGLVAAAPFNANQAAVDRFNTMLMAADAPVVPGYTDPLTIGSAFQGDVEFYMGYREFATDVTDVTQCTDICNATSIFDENNGFTDICKTVIAYLETVTPAGADSNVTLLCAMWTFPYDAATLLEAATNTGYTDENGTVYSNTDAVAYVLDSSSA